MNPSIASLIDSFSFPPLYPTPAFEVALANEAQQFQLDYKGYPLVAYSWGATDAPAVLLMHGWAGRATQLGYLVSPLLAQGLRVLGFDGLAHGQSATDAPEGFRLLDFAAGLHLLAAEVQVRAIVGHSMGAGSSIIALGQGLAADKLVLVAAPRHFSYRLQQIAIKYGISAEIRALLEAYFEQQYGKDIWERGSSEYYAPQLTTPALFIHSEDDEEIPAAESRHLADLWGGEVQYHLVQNLGHSRLLKDAAVIQRIVEFITD